MWNKVIDDWKTPAEYIDREAANLALAEQGFDWDKAKQALASVPAADVVPVVHCKDCVHWDDDPDTYGADYGPKGKCMKSFETMCADDFCSYGKRKDGGVDND